MPRRPVPASPLPRWPSRRHWSLPSRQGAGQWRAAPNRSLRGEQLRRDVADIRRGVGTGRAHQERYLIADRIAYLLVAPDDAGQRRGELQEVLAGLQDRRIGPFALAHAA